jgi:ribonucleotide monophosphatase NagD (HAD superfamily)
VLVLSGATTRELLDDSEIVPTYVLEDVRGLVPTTAR